MKKFRKKPVVIEAVLNDGTVEGRNKVLEFLGTSPVFGARTYGAVFVDTGAGTVVAESGDWVIKGVKGEFYPCKPDIFAATYEPVDGEPHPPTHKSESPYFSPEILEAIRKSGEQFRAYSVPGEEPDTEDLKAEIRKHREENARLAATVERLNERVDDLRVLVNNEVYSNLCLRFPLEGWHMETNLSAKDVAPKEEDA